MSGKRGSEEMGGHRQRRTQRQGSHECKQYKHLLPSPLSHACKAMAPSFSNTPEGTCNVSQSRLLPSPATPFFAVVLLPSTIPSHAHHHGLASACSPRRWHCSAPAWCAQLLLHNPSPACSLEKGVSTINSIAQPPSALVQCSADGPAPLTLHVHGNQAPMLALLFHGHHLQPPSSMVHHRGSVPTSAPIMPASVVPRTRHGICWSLLELMTMRVADPVAG